MKEFISLSVIARIVASILLFLALSRHPYAYYTLLRWVICGVSAYTAYVSNLHNKFLWVWLFSILALFFNPIIPVKLDRATWAIIDVAVGIFLPISIFFVRENPSRIGGNNARQ